VAQALWADEAVEPGAVLDAVVTVVDALHFRRQLEEPSGAEAALQVAHADVVLLNKTDLVSPAELDAVEEAVRGINATAEVLRTQRSAVDLARILGLGTLAKGGQGRRSAEACLLPAAPGASARTQEAPALAFAKGAQQLLSPVHDACISTVFLAAGGLLDEERFRCWLVRPHARSSTSTPLSSL
jgi:G3E family GTPase